MASLLKRLKNNVVDLFDANTESDQQKRLVQGQPRFYQQQQAQPNVQVRPQGQQSTLQQGLQVKPPSFTGAGFNTAQQAPKQLPALPSGKPGLFDVLKEVPKAATDTVTGAVKGLAKGVYETGDTVVNATQYGIAKARNDQQTADYLKGQIKESAQQSLPGAMTRGATVLGNTIGTSLAAPSIYKMEQRGEIPLGETNRILNENYNQSGLDTSQSKATAARKIYGAGAEQAFNIATLGVGAEAATAKAGLGGVFKMGAETGIKYGLPAGLAQIAQEDKITPQSVAQTLTNNVVGAAALPIITGVAGQGIRNLANRTPLNEVGAVGRDVRPTARPNETAVLSDLQDVNLGRVKDPNVINQTLKQARQVGERLGIDVVTGTPFEINQRINAALEQVPRSQSVPSPTGRQVVQNLPGLNSSSPSIVSRLQERLGVKPLNEGGYVQAPDLNYQGTNGVSGKATTSGVTLDNMVDRIDRLAPNNLANQEAITVLQKAAKNPNAEVTVYRAAPGGKVNKGDWVFLTKAEADRFTKTPLGSSKPGVEVISQKAKASDIDWAGKNLEFVYNPQAKKSLKDKLGIKPLNEVGAVGRDVLGETPLAKSERLHQEMLVKNNLTQNEYAALHQNIADLANAESQAHSTAFKVLDNAPRDSKGLLTPEGQAIAKKAADAWAKSQTDRLTALNKVRAIDGEKPIVLGKNQTKSTIPTQEVNTPNVPLAKTSLQENTLTNRAQSTPQENLNINQQRTVGNRPGESLFPEQNLPVSTAQKSLPKTTLREADLPSQTRNRGFIDTIFNDPTTSDKVRQQLIDLDTSYQTRNTKALQTKAATLVKESQDAALRVAMGDKSDVGVAVGSELIKSLQHDGNYEQAIQVAQTLAQNLTEAGRTAQAASIYGKLTPEGVLRFAQKEINKYNEATGRTGSKADKAIKLDETVAKKLTERAQKIEKMQEGAAKNLEVAKLKKDVYDTMPATAPQVLGTLQTMAQLLNPKTIIRNLGGNSMFAGLENVSQTLGAPLDAAISAVRGSERTVALPNLKRQFKGAKEGFGEEFNAARQGVDVGNGTQFDLGNQRTFNKGALGGAETAMNIVLRAPDEGARRGAAFDTLEGLKKANKTDIPTASMEEAAQATGLYRTFQDNSKAAQVFSGLKKTLNKVGIERNGATFGLGDLVVKYPKTPGNILSRGIDYSPLGLTKSIFEIAKPIFGQEFNQREFVNSTSRATVGTGGLVGGGAVLGALGIITEKPEKDTDLRGLQKKSGQGGYQINTSALKRFILSGFNKDAAKIRDGDQLVSYDWAQPAAIPLSAGAAIGKGGSAKEGAGRSVDSLAEGINTLSEQPLVQGVQKFFGSTNSSQGVVDKVTDTAKGIPASFVPTLSNQVGQLTDNTSRNTFDQNPFKESANMVKGRIPGARNTLPARVDSLGDKQEVYQNGSNNLFNVFLNPAFVSKFKPSEEAKLALDVYNRSGETSQAPRVVSRTQKVNGENITLTGQQQADLQQYIGNRTKTFFGDLNKDQSFQSKSDVDKAKIMSNGLADITKAGKVAILGDKVTKSTTQDTKSLVDNPSSKLNYSTSSSGSAKSFKDQYDSAVKDLNQNNNKYSPVTKQRKQDEISQLAVKKNFDKDTVDLYGMSKSKALDFADSQSDPESYKNKLVAYGDARVKAGLDEYNKYRDKNGKATTKKVAKGKGGKKGKGKKLAFSTAGFKTAKIGRVKAPKLAVKKAVYKSKYTPTKSRVA